MTFEETVRVTFHETSNQVKGVDELYSIHDNDMDKMSVPFTPNFFDSLNVYQMCRFSVNSDP